LQIFSHNLKMPINSCVKCPWYYEFVFNIEERVYIIVLLDYQDPIKIVQHTIPIIYYAINCY